MTTTISKFLFAGMLAMGALTPVHNGAQAAQAHTATGACARMTISDALAYQILEGVEGQLEAQLNQSLSTAFLFDEYKNGLAVITYLGQDADGLYQFSVAYMDGIAEVLLEVLP